MEKQLAHLADGTPIVIEGHLEDGRTVVREIIPVNDIDCEYAYIETPNIYILADGDQDGYLFAIGKDN